MSRHLPVVTASLLAVLTVQAFTQQAPAPPAAAQAAASGAPVVIPAPKPRWGSDKGLTDVQGLKVGHHTLTDRPTGCTVILASDGTTGGVDVRGGAPGTRETDLLDPVNNVQIVNAISLSGGSAYGLDVAQGVMRYLEEHNIGYRVGQGVVPIVPAAILMDLGFGGSFKIRPTHECGYAAATAATDGPVQEGSIGAGTGATVGKGAQGRSMKGGLGSASITLPDGLVVAAIVAVNAVGDVIDPETGKVIAGMRTEDGKGLVDRRQLMRSGALSRRPQPRAGENTTIGVVATNAKLTKVQAQKVAQMAHDGFARAISPIHTPGDGDTIFSLATGKWEGDVNLSLIGSLAAEAMADAIVRAVTQTESVAMASGETLPEGGGPDRATHHEREEHRGAGQVLGAPRQVMQLEGHPVDRRLDAGVQQLDDQHQPHRAGEQRDLHPTPAEPEGQWQQGHGEPHLLLEGVLLPVGDLEAIHRVAGGADHPVHPGASFVRIAHGEAIVPRALARAPRGGLSVAADAPDDGSPAGFPRGRRAGTAVAGAAGSTARRSSRRRRAPRTPVRRP